MSYLATNGDLFVDTDSGIGITSAISGNIGMAGDTVCMAEQRTIATAGTAGTKGEICHDADYIYVCVATNTWKRVAIVTW